MSRTPRELEDRESEKRTSDDWRPPALLPTPFAKPGVKFRWIRTSARGEGDIKNVSSRFREGWEPVKAADHPNVRAMFDTHHANVEEKNFGEAIATIAPVLAHVHISENDRGTPGDGHINFDETFSALAKINYKGWLTIEAFSRNDPDFANAIGVWREFSDPWDIAENGYKFIREMSLKHGLGN